MKILLIGNMNAITYKEVFPLIKENKIWLGVNPVMNFESLIDKQIVKFGNICWFTNLDHGRRHNPLSLMTMADNIKFSKHSKIKDIGYSKYDNYNAIEVCFVDAIPSDYKGVMGVPISFLDKYCPEQFEIIGGLANGQVPNNYKIGNYKTYNNPIIKDRKVYQRILIKHKGDSNENSIAD